MMKATLDWAEAAGVSSWASPVAWARTADGEYAGMKPGPQVLGALLRPGLGHYERYIKPDLGGEQRRLDFRSLRGY